MKTILVAIDFSQVSGQLLSAASQIAKPDSKVYLIHVAAPEPDFVGYGVGPEYIRDDRANELREEHKMLNEFKEKLINQGIDAEALLVGGPTVETLMAEIKKLKADFFIIGRRGHSKFYNLVMGSVCKEILPKLKIPTLVIPEETKE
jgi:nucleotide-binding universal stress UspA family protein